MNRYTELATPMPKDTNVSAIVITTLSVAQSGRTIAFDLPDPQTYARTDLERFLKDYAAGHAGAGSLLSKATDRPKTLGIPLNDIPSFVVVVLSPTVNWRFRATGPAITAKRDYGPDNYGPWHFDANGNQLDPAAPGPACQIACFAAVRRGYLEIQSFNLHLEFLQSDGRWLEIVIDPDVPETGHDGFPLLGV